MGGELDPFRVRDDSSASNPGCAAATLGFGV
jgi:hypothetical protein